MLKKIESVIVADDNYDDAIAFFRDKLALEMPLESADMVRFELDNFPIFVARSKQGAGAFISIESDDIESDYEILQRRGVKFEEPLNTMKGGDRAAFFRGPSGLMFMLYQPSLDGL